MKKKAQEEMVGFVLIMLVVAVIFVIFLGIFLKKGATETADSEEISQFLEAISEYTTECGPTSYPEKLSRVVTLCSEGKKCNIASTEDPCDILADTLEELVNASWNFNENSPTKGYQISAIRETADGPDSVLDRTIRGGDISSTRRRSSEKIFNGVILKLEILV